MNTLIHLMKIILEYCILACNIFILNKIENNKKILCTHQHKISNQKNRKSINFTVLFYTTQTIVITFIWIEQTIMRIVNLIILCLSVAIKSQHILQTRVSFSRPYMNTCMPNNFSSLNWKTYIMS